MNIKDRLKEMSKLFKEEEGREDKLEGSLLKLEEAASNLKEWDLEGHQIMYAEAIKQRKR